MYFSRRANTHRRAKAFAAIVYLVAAVAIEARVVLIHQGDFDRWGFVVPVLAMAAFVASYTHLLIDPSIRPAQRVALLIANTSVLAGVLYACLANPDIFSDIPFDQILGSYVIPILLLLIAGAMWFRWKYGFLAASLVSLLVSPMLAWLAYAQGFFSFSRGQLDPLACLSAPLVLVAAMVITCTGRRSGDALALVAAALAWPHFVKTERSYLYSANAWNLLNSNQPEVIAYGKINLITLLLLILATVCALVRLLPPGWSLRSIPVRDRLWPVLAASFAVVAVWFVTSARPYVVPEPHHGVLAEIAILHLRKRGLHLQETKVVFFRDSKTYVSRNERKPFRYHANGMYYSVVLSPESRSRIWDFCRSAQFLNARTQRRTSPRRWNSESWYVYRNGGLYGVFSDGDNTRLPEELMRWFEETEKLPPQSAATPAVINDVCLGFCYDPARL